MKITYKLVRQELQIPFTVPSFPCLSPSHTLPAFPSLPWTGPALTGPPRPLTQTQPHRPPPHSLSFKDKTPATHSLSSYSINFSPYPWVLLFSKQMFFHLKQIPFPGANKCSFILKQIPFPGPQCFLKLPIHSSLSSYIKFPWKNYL